MSEYATQPQEVQDEIKQELDHQDKLRADRSVFESHWQECLDYIVPRKGTITTKGTPGEKRGNELFDTTSIMSNQLLAGALHGMLTNPSTRFFDLVIDDPLLSDDDEVQNWLNTVADKMFSVMNGSNFQTEVHELYIDIGAIGTSAMFVGEHEENVVHFGTRPMQEIYVDEDNLGRIDRVNREFKWKPRQIIQEFGEENVPEYVVEQNKKGCSDAWEILHVVAPQEGTYFKYKSLYILKDKKLQIQKKGFPEMPYAVPRWTKTTGEKYGRGPGMDMLPDIKMVNKMMETTIKGAQITIAPPFTVTDDGVIGKVRLTPFGLTVVRPGAEVKPLISDARIDFGQQVVEDVRKRIRSGFYVDQLQLNEGPQMTATEVMQRTEEKLRLMGPVLGRQHYEFLRPVIYRVYAIMARKKLLPTAPQKLHGKNWDVQYSSLVARAQRMSDGQNIARGISVAAPIINLKPEVMDNLNGDAYFKYVMNTIYGTPTKLFNDARTIQKIRDARSKATQQVAQQRQEQHQADIASKVGPAVAQIQQSNQGTNQ